MWSWSFLTKELLLLGWSAFGCKINTYVYSFHLVSGSNPPLPPNLSTRLFYYFPHKETHMEEELREIYFQESFISSRFIDVFSADTTPILTCGKRKCLKNIPEGSYYLQRKLLKFHHISCGITRNFNKRTC